MSVHASIQYFFLPKTQINDKNAKGAAVPKKTSGEKSKPKAILIREGLTKQKDTIKATNNLFFLKNLKTIVTTTKAYRI